jgi:hypothetical protein
MQKLWITTIFLLSACSTTVTGPITGRQYHVDVGCTENMQAYQREREAVVGTGKETTAPEVKIDCPAAPDPQP